MKTVLVTGAEGFIGKNLCAALSTLKGVEILTFTRKNSIKELESSLKKADFIFHIAGVNRSKDDREFDIGNRGLTETILNILEKLGKNTPLLVSSSTHATLENAYGKSKKAAEDLILEWHEKSKSQVFIYRLTNVFGKWSNPNYNSVVATFCNNIAHNKPIEISDASHEITLVYIDTVVKSFIGTFLGEVELNSSHFYDITETYVITLGNLAQKIKNFHASRSSLVMPELTTDFDRYIYAAYISYLPADSFSYDLEKNTDERGWLAEFIKAKQFGQIFISKTKPGITRGNHWHNTKVEKFLVVEGEAVITFRKYGSDEIIEYSVSGEKPEVVDIPTGYVHAITNTGKDTLITIFWASEILNQAAPDTIYETVKKGD